MDQWLCLICWKKLYSEDEVKQHLEETKDEPEHKRMRQEIDNAQRQSAL